MYYFFLEFTLRCHPRKGSGLITPEHQACTNRSAFPWLLQAIPLPHHPALQVSPSVQKSAACHRAGTTTSCASSAAKGAALSSGKRAPLGKSWGKLWRQRMNEQVETKDSQTQVAPKVDLK